jgi:hypothetical protein
MGAYWKVEPKMKFPAGAYEIIDSDPSTWAQNEGTNGMGMCWANGYTAK